MVLVTAAVYPWVRTMRDMVDGSERECRSRYVMPSETDGYRSLRQKLPSECDKFRERSSGLLAGLICATALEFGGPRDFCMQCS